MLCGEDVLDSREGAAEFGEGGGSVDKVLSTGWAAFAGMHSVFVGAGFAGMVKLGESDLLSLGALWGTRAGVVLCCAGLLWLEYRWRGAQESELDKLSWGWRAFVRVAELVLLLSAKVFLFNCVLILMGGNWFGALVCASFAGLVVGWVLLGIALRANRKVGFYVDAGQVRPKVESALAQSERRGNSLLVDEGWLVRSTKNSSVWNIVPWGSDDTGGLARNSDPGKHAS